jgi:uncharacterized protein
MSAQYGCIAFTDDVRRVQSDYGSAEFYARVAERGRAASDHDPLGPRESEFGVDDVPRRAMVSASDGTPRG